MANTPAPAGSTVVASLRYHDAHAAIEWLCAVLGFTVHAVYAGPENLVAHAQLTLGSGMVMLGSAANPSPFMSNLVHPRDLTKAVLPPVYLAVPDCDPVWECVQQKKAEVLQPLETMEYGGQSFTVKDPEGYLWTVGEYNPWKGTDQIEDC